MPYRWTSPAPDNKLAELTLWPHRSMPRHGFVWFIGITFCLILLPVIPLLGTKVLWGLLPFLMGAVWLIYYFIDRNYRDGELTERLSLWSDRVELTRANPRGTAQQWEANPYWVKVELHEKGGPVEHYLTMSGSGRVVEIGAFLSPEERIGLRDELECWLSRAALPDKS